MTSKKALIIIIEGSEEMEIIIPADTLRRAMVNVTIAGVNGPNVINCGRGAKIQPDDSLENAAKNGPYDIIILPGGIKGSKNLVNSEAVGNILRKQESEGGMIATICAASTALKQHDIFRGKTLTSHPLVSDSFNNSDYKYSQDRVVIDGQLITSQGPGTASEFAFAIVEKLFDKVTSDKLKKDMLFKH